MVENQLMATRRDSNLELYRIIVMIMIVAHHYVVNSGLLETIKESPETLSGYAMLLFGAWGKTGINCFVLITGYFMCKSRITLHKFIKLYLQIVFYSVFFYVVFSLCGYQSFSISRLVLLLLPVRSIGDNFVGCFMIFYLLIPFLTILVRHVSRREHSILIALLLLYHTLLPVMPFFSITMNYVSWFCVLFIVSSYIRFYGLLPKCGHRFWGVASLLLLLLSSSSVMTLFHLYKVGIINHFIPYYLISDSNMPLALLTAISSFMWFKGVKLQYINIINQIGGGTFAVLLIHANSETMCQWLWMETIKPVEHFGELWPTLLYAAASVLIIFFACSVIEQIRIAISKHGLFRITRWIPVQQ